MSWLSPEDPGAGAVATPGAEATLVAYLSERMLWLVRLRWLAMGAVLVTTAVAAWMHVLEQPLLLLIGAAFIGAGNLAVLLAARSGGAAPGLRYVQTVVLAQILLDLVALTLLLQLAGGVENPFSMLYVMLMALAAMLLPLRLALLAALAACMLHGASLVGELWGLFPHMRLSIGSHDEYEALGGAGLWESPVFVASYLLAFAMTQLGVVLLVHQVVERYRDAEDRRRKQEVVAVSRERLARIGSLAAGVAHTVRNPLHGLLNGVDILARQIPVDDEATREILGVMHEGIQRIETVTSRLLTLTRSAPLRPERTELKLLVEDALRFVKLRSRELGVRIDLDVRDELFASVDVVAMSEALASIVDNAVYACSGGGRVAVSVSAAPGGQARIAVSDTGGGIDPAALAQVFDPFFTTKPIGEGSGLGLAIARRAVEEHGGAVRLDSVLGEGTTVTIEIPTEARQ